MEEAVAFSVKDGIFIGDQFAAHDRMFLTLNKITHIINCAGGEVKNVFQPSIEYLTFYWNEEAAAARNSGVRTNSANRRNLTSATATLRSHGNLDRGIMFDSADVNIKRICAFIDTPLRKGECVLVHDQHGRVRCCCVVAAYLIFKYHWRLEWAIALIRISNPDYRIQCPFRAQLEQFAATHSPDLCVFDEDSLQHQNEFDDEQLTLRNTVLNGLSENKQQSNLFYRQIVEKTREFQPVESHRALGAVWRCVKPGLASRSSQILFEDYPLSKGACISGEHYSAYVEHSVISGVKKLRNSEPCTYSNSLLVCSTSARGQINAHSRAFFSRLGESSRSLTEKRRNNKVEANILALKNLTSIEGAKHATPLIAFTKGVPPPQRKLSALDSSGMRYTSVPLISHDSVVANVSHELPEATVKEKDTLKGRQVISIEQVLPPEPSRHSNGIVTPRDTTQEQRVSQYVLPARPGRNASPMPRRLLTVEERGRPSSPSRRPNQLENSKGSSDRPDRSRPPLRATADTAVMHVGRTSPVVSQLRQLTFTPQSSLNTPAESFVKQSSSPRVSSQAQNRENGLNRRPGFVSIKSMLRPRLTEDRKSSALHPPPLKVNEKNIKNVVGTVAAGRASMRQSSAPQRAASTTKVTNCKNNFIGEKRSSSASNSKSRNMPRWL